MKVAITSYGKDLTSDVDQRFGRAGWFIVVDTETGGYEAVNNEKNLNASQGAGIQAAENISRSGAEVLITGNCGPNAFRTLNAAGIKVVCNAKGTVSEGLEKYKKGELQETSGANVDGHWS